VDLLRRAFSCVASPIGIGDVHNHPGRSAQFKNEAFLEHPYTPAYWPGGSLIALDVAAPIEARRRRRQRKRSPMPVRLPSSASAYSAAPTAAARSWRVPSPLRLSAPSRCLAGPPSHMKRGPPTRSTGPSYAQPAPPGPVYEDGRATTGEPIYLRLANTVDITFAYDVDADVVGRDGILAVRAVLGDGSG
jgi:hypothetical protein